MKIDLSRLVTAEAKEAEAATRRADARAAEARAYLAATDWMIVRQAETGKPVPEDVLEKRRAAREVI